MNLLSDIMNVMVFFKKKSEFTVWYSLGGEKPKFNFGFVKWCTCALTENKFPKIHSHTSLAPTKDWKVMILLEIV